METLKNFGGCSAADKRRIIRISMGSCWLPSSWSCFIICLKSGSRPRSRNIGHPAAFPTWLIIADNIPLPRTTGAAAAGRRWKKNRFAFFFKIESAPSVINNRRNDWALLLTTKIKWAWGGSSFHFSRWELNVDITEQQRNKLRPRLSRAPIAVLTAANELLRLVFFVTSFGQTATSEAAMTKTARGGKTFKVYFPFYFNNKNSKFVLHLEL